MRPETEKAPKVAKIKKEKIALADGAAGVVDEPKPLTETQIKQVAKQRDELGEILGKLTAAVAEAFGSEDNPSQFADLIPGYVKANAAAVRAKAELMGSELDLLLNTPSGDHKVQSRTPKM